MSDDTHSGAGWSAAALRAEMAAREMRGLDAEAAARRAEAEQQRAFRIDFLMHHLSPGEIKHARTAVEAAMRQNAFEALIYAFPSALCTDDGRAINNAEPSWPGTLQGKAREVYEAFERHGRPMGFHLKAMIVTFPGGIPGDVGFFLNWAPPAL